LFYQRGIGLLLVDKTTGTSDVELECTTRLPVDFRIRRQDQDLAAGARGI
jgi:hypothetical protein